MSHRHNSHKSPHLPPCLDEFQKVQRYWDATNHVFCANVLPGEYYVTLHKEMTSTLLGSCVSACIRDVRLGVGGMNHFLLPLSQDESNDRWLDDVYGLSTRYGNFAMEQLINCILKAGGQRRFLEAKIVGGAKVLAIQTDIGASNIEFVRHYLESEGIEIVSEDVGSSSARLVHYYPDDGALRVKKLAKVQEVVQEEENYMGRLVASPPTGDIELF